MSRKLCDTTSYIELNFATLPLEVVKILQVKYLNNIVEQDHRFIKKLTRPMMGFKSVRSASATLQGIEVAHMIRKRQFGLTTQSAFQQFATLAG